MKILILHPSFWVYGGAERVIVKLANYLTEHNHTCTILTTQMIPEVRKDLIETRLILCKNIAEMNEWYNKIHKDFDITNFHNDPVQLLSFGKKTPSVWLCNEPPQACLEGKTLPDNLKEAVKKFINKVIVADKFNQERFKKIYDMDSTIIPYGVDFDFWQKGADYQSSQYLHKKFREKYGLKSDDFVMTQVGFIHPMKNQAKTIQIFKEIKDKVPNAKLILAGHKTPYKQELEDFIFKNNLQADIIFTGLISQEEIRDLYHGSNLAIFPIKSQGGWLSIFDAMACGLRVYVSKEATCSSILAENNLGCVCDTVEDFVHAIIQNKGNKHSTDDLEWVKANLSWDKFCEKMLEVFNENNKSV